MEYVVNGSVKMGLGMKEFKLKVTANSEQHAKQKTYAHFGSTSGLKQVNVKIKKVSAV